jgi:hypothetical protein
VPKPGEVLGDPRQGEVSLPAGNGWDASLVLDNQGVGVWIVGSFQVYDETGCPEVIGLDDRGRLFLLTSYSGRWTPLEGIRDGAWLGGLAWGDGDPRMPGRELYTGSQRGNLYQVLAHESGVLESRLIGRIADRSINTLILDDLDPATPGLELLLFTWPGGLYLATPTGDHGTFEIRQLADVAGRVRDVVRLPYFAGRPPEVACVSRDGSLQVLSLTPSGPPVWQTIYKAEMGMGRVALAPRSDGAVVLYSTRDDGMILRHERTGAETWKTEVIYLGPQGPRGIAAGRFDADPLVETLAIFGYSGKVEVLSRKGREPWTVETVYRDADKGHWIAVCEVDGRNATQELVASGFGGRIVLLSRPPGYGRSELAVQDDE